MAPLISFHCVRQKVQGWETLSLFSLKQHGHAAPWARATKNVQKPQSQM